MTDSLLHRSRSLFIRRWGEMAASWGVSRTMAEIHALLFISNMPLCTDDFMAQLQVSRGNVSMNVRQLLNWGLIHRVHQRGDRKEYFVCELDIWQMFEIITRERRRREVEPIVETIAKCRQMLGDELQSTTDENHAEIQEFAGRLERMEEFFATMNGLFNLSIKAGKSGITRALTVLAKLDG